VVDGEEPRAYRTWDRYFDEAGIAALLSGRGFAAFEIQSGLVAKNDFASSDVLFVAARKIE
jgi:hypothetical protein